MAKAFFITGTDTDVGKTFCTVALLRAFAQLRLRVVGMKPVAAGAAVGGLNDDVVALMTASNVVADVADVNPYCFSRAIAPHIAAAEENCIVSIALLPQSLQRLHAQSDVVLIEGAGGFLVPLNAGETMADLAVALGAPIILVVGMRLGCLNHALLTAEAIRARGLHLAGWIANCIDPAMPAQFENIKTLEERLNTPLLGIIPYLQNAKKYSAADDLAAANHLNISTLLKLEVNL
jgi:dethiobiotin synthetase